jgi:hypothetical protein
MASSTQSCLPPLLLVPGLSLTTEKGNCFPPWGGGAEEPLDKEDEEAEVGMSRSEGGGSGGRT